MPSWHGGTIVPGNCLSSQLEVLTQTSKPLTRYSVHRNQGILKQSNKELPLSVNTNVCSSDSAKAPCERNCATCMTTFTTCVPLSHIQPPPHLKGQRTKAWLLTALDLWQNGTRQSAPHTRGPSWQANQLSRSGCLRGTLELHRPLHLQLSHELWSPLYMHRVANFSLQYYGINGIERQHQWRIFRS